MRRMVLALLAGLMISNVMAQESEKKAPDALVKNAIESVMTAVRHDPAGKEGDVAKIGKLVEQKFLPFTDFQRTTRLAVGAEAWKKATAEQRKQLFEQFQALLVSTYAAQLAQLRDQKVEFRYQPVTVAGGATDIAVQTHVLTNGDDMAIGYRLGLTQDGWKIYDINMMGAWLIQVYRQQFADKLSQGGVDGLVKFLAEHNAP